MIDSVSGETSLKNSRPFLVTPTIRWPWQANILKKIELLPISNLPE